MHTGTNTQNSIFGVGMIQVGQEIQGRVEKLIFQGKGLIRHEGWVIFVDDVISGEEVTVQITEKKKSYFLGKLVNIVTTSPFRVVPPCPYFGTCGGCQLQHMDYKLQVQEKEKWLNEALSHQLTLPQPITCLPAEKEWAYRRKVTLHFEWSEKENRFLLGYYAKDNRTLLEVTVCPIFTKAEDPIFEEARAFLATLTPSPRMQGELTILKMENRYLLRFFFAPELPENAKNALSLTPCKSLIWLESYRQTIGVEAKEFVVDALGLQVYISPKVFLQNYPEASLKLYQQVIELLKDASSVLDLYCGVGILTMLLAKGKNGREVFGIEYNKEAIRLAKMSASLNGIQTVGFSAGKVEDLVGPRLQIKKYDAWIVNPPREGMSKEMVECILTHLPGQIIYISCMPSTLTRDIVLLKDTYHIAQGIGYDMFPQTTHLETVISLRRK